MKATRNIFLFTLLLCLGYACSDKEIDQPTTENKTKTETYTTLIGLAQASGSIDNKGIDLPKQPVNTQNPVGTRAGENEVVNYGYLKFNDPAASTTLTIDHNNSDFTTWIFLTRPDKKATAYALLKWDASSLTDNNKKIRLTAHDQNIELHWFGDPIDIKAGDNWYVSAVLGGGKLTKNQEAYQDVSDPDGLTSQNAFRLSFEGLPTINTNAKGVVQAPFVTGWEKLKITGDNRVDLSLTFRLKGNLVRAKIQEDNAVSEQTDQYSQQYDYVQNKDYRKIYILRSSTFNQPSFYIPTEVTSGYNLENKELVTANVYSNFPVNEKSWVLIPNHPQQDLGNKDNHLFMEWGMPKKMAKDEVEDPKAYYTFIVPSNGGFVLGGKKNDYIGQFITTNRPQKQGVVYSLGQLKEVHPRITPLDVEDPKSGKTKDDIMEFPIPLEALAENNLGKEPRVFAKDPKTLTEQGAWSRDQLIPNSGQWDEDLYRNFPHGYRGPLREDYTFAFPFFAEEFTTKSDNSVLKSKTIKSPLDFKDIAEGGDLYGVDIPEWFIRSYKPGKTEQGSQMEKVVTGARYYATDKIDNTRYNTIYAYRFMPFGGDETSQKLGNSHKCVYRYDFRKVPQGVWYDHIGKKDYPNEQQFYVVVRARYVGDSPVYESMLKDERWWNMSFPTEVVRYFAMTGNARTDQRKRGDTGHEFQWGKRTRNALSNWIDIEDSRYLSMTLYYNKGGLDTFNAEEREITRWKFERNGDPGYYGYPIRPVRDYTHM